MAEKWPDGIEPERVIELIERFRSNLRTIERAREMVLATHDGGWVGSHEGELVFGSSIEEVVSEAKRREWRLGVVAIEPVRRERPPLLLGTHLVTRNIC